MTAITLAAGRRATAYVLLIGVLGCVAAMSWAGLYGFARDTLGWSDWHAALVPVALDIAAMVCALLALDSIARGDAAASLRLLTACFVALSAFVNWRTALATGNVAAQIFFPSMSILAYALVHAVMSKYRREVRRDLAGRQHRVTLAPLPRLGAAAWARYPARAFRTTSEAVARRFDGALGKARASAHGARDRAHDAAHATHDAAHSGAQIATRAATHGAHDAAHGLSLADAIRAGISEVGAQPHDVIGWLEAHGRTGVAPRRVHEILRRDAARRPPLRSVGGQS
jgi:hypothetical protein